MVCIRTIMGDAILILLVGGLIIVIVSVAQVVMIVRFKIDVVILGPKEGSGQ